MKKIVLMLVMVFSFAVSGCVNIVSSVEEVPEQYREDYLYFNQVKIGMSRSESYAIIGDPGIEGKPIKVRWLVYEDDPIGGIEVIYIEDKVVKVTFSRFTKPSFGFSKRGHK